MKIIIAIDGACSGNGTANANGGWCAILQAVEGDKVLKETVLSGGASQTTNNQMELEALVRGLNQLTRSGVEVEIMTDSAYVIGTLSQGWKARKNVELVDRARKMVSNHKVTFTKISGHSGHALNERADSIARQKAGSK